MSIVGRRRYRPKNNAYLIAKHQSYCGWCGQSISPGDRIYRSKSLGTYCHEGCPPAKEALKAKFNR